MAELRAMADKAAAQLSTGIAEYLVGDEYEMDQVVDIAKDIADAIERVAKAAVEAGIAEHEKSQQRIEQYFGKPAAATPRWTTEPPTKNGHYWARYRKGGHIEPVRIYEDCREVAVQGYGPGLVPIEEFDLWSGPIDPPNMTQGI
jgi:hypothetical protein